MMANLYYLLRNRIKQMVNDNPKLSSCIDIAIKKCFTLKKALGRAWIVGYMSCIYSCLILLFLNIKLPIYFINLLLKGGYPIICIECFSQVSFDSEVYTKSAAVADFVYTSELNESCEKHSTQR